ncbi:MAG: protein kinase, partial [Myxococcales bacterium]|nr:protein kinase [Myxococcales bacterium]
MDTDTSKPAGSVLPISDKDLQPGQQVGEYVVEAKIGEGGFGTVFRASHPLIGKVAAVKVLNRQYSADPEMVSRFVAEARAVNQIRHRNIIDIFAFGALDDGRHYYVMEFLDGQPLDEYLGEVGAMALGDAIPILRSVARALDAAHAKGIAHRDLKPENIFLAHESDGTVFPKLLDFGIAKLMGSSAGGSMHKTRTGAPIGTPYYMSPEQCRGRDVDHRTDIYAFGVVAYKLLTGEVPFDGDDYMDILLKQIGEEPVPPSQRLPGLPASVDDAIAWMMKKDPAGRPPNLISAMRALEDAAVAAGVDFATDGASGLYSVPTAAHRAQRTPSAITPMPRPNRTPDASLGNAATMDASSLSDAMNAVTAPTATPGALPATPVTTLGGTPAPVSRKIWLIAAIGAVIVGASVFVLVHSMRGDAAGGTAGTATS